MSCRWIRRGYVERHVYGIRLTGMPSFARVHPQRPADLDAGAFPEAHGQAAAAGAADLAASPELAADVRGPDGSEILKSCSMINIFH